MIRDYFGIYRTTRWTSSGLLRDYSATKLLAKVNYSASWYAKCIGSLAAKAAPYDATRLRPDERSPHQTRLHISYGPAGRRSASREHLGSGSKKTISPRRGHIKDDLVKHPYSTTLSPRRVGPLNFRFGRTGNEAGRQVEDRKVRDRARRGETLRRTTTRHGIQRASSTANCGR